MRLAHAALLVYSKCYFTLGKYTAADVWEDLLNKNTCPQSSGRCGSRTMDETCKFPEYEFPPSTPLGHMRAARAVTGKARPISQDDPRVFALLFLTVRGISTGTHWERWLLDAHDYIKNELQIPVESALLTKVAYAPAFDEDAVKEYLPPALRGSLMAAPQGCAWAENLRNERALVEEAFTTTPRVGYFVVVSHNSIPLKSFKFMYEAFLRDSRIRMSLSEWDIGVRGLFKTANWRAFPRRIAQAMLNDPDYPQFEWLGWRGGRSCGPDECRVWTPAVKAFGEELFDDFVFMPVAVAVPMYGLPAHFFFDCWDDDIYGCPKTNRAASSPTHYNQFEPGFLDLMIDHPYIWMFRKCEDSTTVGGTRASLASDYIAERLNSSYGHVHVPQPPHDNELPTLKYEGVTYEDQVKFWYKHQVYGLRSDLHV